MRNQKAWDSSKFSLKGSRLHSFLSQWSRLQLFCEQMDWEGWQLLAENKVFKKKWSQYQFKQRLKSQDKALYTP